MGWMSWVRFTCEINCKEYPEDCIRSDLFKNMADRLVADGYHDVGYEYVNIDDCWSELARDERTQQLVPDQDRFPEGIKSLADYVHNKGLKLGIYGDCGTKTCAGYPSQLKGEFNYEDNYFDTDANSFSEWQVDSFKFDGCNIDPWKAESICPQMSRSLKATQRPIYFMCEWPLYMIQANRSAKIDWPLVQASCNAWRYYIDSEDSWQSIQGIIDYSVNMQSTIVRYHGPGSWFDPDQLVIGNFGLSLEQARAQMAIWSIWSAPLYMSNDLRRIDPEMAKVLKNKNLIGINQDQLGIFGLMVAQQNNGTIQAFVKPIEVIKNGCPSFAIVYLYRNALGDRRLVSFNLRQLLKRAPIEIAANRYDSIYKGGKPGGEFNAAKCLERLEKAMTRKIPPNLVVGQGQTIEELEVRYQVFDLINEENLDNIALNSDLELKVSPSGGVRAVKLVEL